MGTRIQFLVSFELPDGASPGDGLSYTFDAVRSWSGSLEPPGASKGDGTYADGDPMFHLDKNTVQVQRSPPWNVLRGGRGA